MEGEGGGCECGSTRVGGGAQGWRRRDARMQEEHKGGGGPGKGGGRSRCCAQPPCSRGRARCGAGACLPQPPSLQSGSRHDSLVSGNAEKTALRDSWFVHCEHSVCACMCECVCPVVVELDAAVSAHHAVVGGYLLCSAEPGERGLVCVRPRIHFPLKEAAVPPVQLLGDHHLSPVQHHPFGSSHDVVPSNSGRKREVWGPRERWRCCKACCCPFILVCWSAGRADLPSADGDALLSKTIAQLSSMVML